MDVHDDGALRVPRSGLLFLLALCAAGAMLWLREPRPMLAAAPDGGGPVTAEAGGPTRIVMRRDDPLDPNTVRTDGGRRRIVISGRGSSRGVLAVESSILARTEALLPDRFRRVATRDFVVLTDADDGSLSRVLWLLDETAISVERFARRLGLETTAPSHRDVVVLFGDEEDFRAFAIEHDGVRIPWVSGYYAPASRRSVFMLAGGTREARRLAGELAELEGRVAELDRERTAALRDGRGDDAILLRRQAEEVRALLATERSRLDDSIDAASASLLVHEVVHQIVDLRAVLPARPGLPPWLVEGLAGAFEPEHPDAPFGPTEAWSLRRHRLADAEWIPIRDLVRVRDFADLDPDLVSLAYDQSASLVSFLARERPTVLGAMLARWGEVAPADAWDAFGEQIGDVDEFEQAWRRSVGRR